MEEENEILLASLLSMGIPEEDAKEAIFITGGAGLDVALDYVFNNKASTASPTNNASSSNKTPVKKVPSTTAMDVDDDYSDYPSQDDHLFTHSDKKKEDPAPPPSKQEDDDYASKRKKLTESLASQDESDILEYLDDDEPFQGVELNYKTVRVIEKNQITKEVDEEITRISTMFEVSYVAAAALLKHYKWQSERLIESYFDNESKVMKEVGIDGKQDRLIATKEALQKASRDIATTTQCTDCLICADDFDMDKVNFSGLPLCKHVFCDTCWKSYLEGKINEGGSLDIHCMAHKCTTKVPTVIVQKVVAPEFLRKYRQFVVKSFVEDNPFMKWCPAANCGNAVKSDVLSEGEVRCHCGFKFCFQCSGEAHVPATCANIKDWAKKAADDSETANWITANTNDCPKCHSAIEKNGGCNHMTCRKCHHEFCWICFKDWKGHSACNAYDKDKSAVSAARGAIERYLHYFHRYDVHEQSKKFEQQLREKAVLTMMEIRSEKEHFVDVEYIDKATEQLIECRRTLKHTYVLAYFLPEGPEKTLFEYLQADLERDTERLSGLLERPDAFECKKEMLNLTSVAAKRLHHLLEGVKTGLTEVAVPKNNGIGSSVASATTAVLNKFKSVVQPPVPVNNRRFGKSRSNH